MVKLIPLTCEKCGANLDVRDEVKYVTCLSCSTKYSIVEEGNTKFLIVVENKKSSEQEFCEIVFERKYGSFGIDHVSFWANAITAEGVNCLFKTWKVDTITSGSPLSSAPSHVSAHNCLVLALKKTGWTPQGRGSEWYSLQFLRGYNDMASDLKEQIDSEERFFDLLFEGIEKHFSPMVSALQKSDLLKENSISKKPKATLFNDGTEKDTRLGELFVFLSGLRSEDLLRAKHFTKSAELQSWFVYAADLRS